MDKIRKIKINYNFKITATKIFVSIINLVLFLELFLFRSTIDFIVKLIIFMLVLFTSFYLIKSVKYEVKSREKIEELAKEFADMNEDLSKLNEQKSEFVIASAYHLMAPLTAITGYSSMVLEESFGFISEKVRDAFERIFESSKRLGVIIDDFTNISKIESGEMDYKFASADLEKITRETISEMMPVAKNLGLELGYGVDREVDYMINMDEGKIRQVVSNLLDNALKYTPKGSVNVSLGKSESDGNILLKIKDTGIGMNQETIDKIFLKFSRAKEARKFYTEGSGLGLYVAHEILKKHNARVWATSYGLGMGSVFNIEFKN